MQVRFIIQHLKLKHICARECGHYKDGVQVFLYLRLLSCHISLPHVTDREQNNATATKSR